MSALPCPIEDNWFAAAEQEFDTITTFLRSKEASSLTHSDLERTLEAKGRELMRKLMQAHLDTRSPGEAASPVRDATYETRSRAQLHERQLETIFGTVTVSRAGYGTEGKLSLHPLDGNLTQLDSLHKLASDWKIDMYIFVDFIHVAQYAWKAALAFHPRDPEKQDAWVRTRLLEILRGKAVNVAGGMRRSATLQSMEAAERKPVDDCADYLLHYAPYLTISGGLPIATGVIEGACRHLVNDRINVTGARWSLSGAEAVLRLRALRSSGDFDDYWGSHELQEYERNNEASKNGLSGGFGGLFLMLRAI
jgi:hypothetical protein